MCPCGQPINLGNIPVDRGVAICSHAALGQALAAAATRLTEGRPPDLAEAERVLYETLGLRSGTMTFGCQCDNCGRLLVFDDEDEIVGVFAPEDHDERTGRQLDRPDLVDG